MSVNTEPLPNSAAVATSRWHLLAERVLDGGEIDFAERS